MSHLPADAHAVVTALKMEPHPEGGWYRRWYESKEMWTAPAVADDAGPEAWTPGSVRFCGTAIQYLLTAGNKSSLHQLKSDELWFWHAGGPLTVVVLGAEGPQETVVGPNTDAGQAYVHTVRGGQYFGAYLPDGCAWSLVSCVVVPGFDFADWRMLSKSDLTARFPSCSGIIERLAAAESELAAPVPSPAR